MGGRKNRFEPVICTNLAIFPHAEDSFKRTKVTVHENMKFDVRSLA